MLILQITSRIVGVTFSSWWSGSRASNAEATEKILENQHGVLAKWGQKEVGVKIAFIVAHRCASQNVVFFLQFIALRVL